MKKIKYKDHPFDAVCRKAEELVKQGLYVHQKFTCAGCGNRLTMSTPNHFYEEGTCDNCPTVTNIRKQGCNYLVMNTRLGETPDGKIRLGS